MKIKKDENFIWIEEYDGSELYSIYRPAICEYREPLISEHVSQLLDKTWITSTLLYELAVHIQTDCPDNSFDWYRLFFMVEKKDYLEDTESLLREAKKQDLSLWDIIDLGAESTEEVDNVIRNIVTTKLERYGLRRSF